MKKYTKKITKIISVCLMLAFNSYIFANENNTAPSDESLKQLMVITNIKQVTNDAMAQIDNITHDFIQKNIATSKITEAQKIAEKNMDVKFKALMQNEYSWDILEPEFTKIYKNVLTQSEVNDMIAFYKTPSGQAVVKKMPLIMQQSIVLSQSMIQKLTPKITKIFEEFFIEIKGKEALPAQSMPPKQVQHHTRGKTLKPNP